MPAGSVRASVPPASAREFAAKETRRPASRHGAAPAATAATAGSASGQPTAAARTTARATRQRVMAENLEGPRGRRGPSVRHRKRVEGVSLTGTARLGRRLLRRLVRLCGLARLGLLGLGLLGRLAGQ